SDRTCGTDDDESLGDAGWDVKQCPNFENGNCDNEIVDCTDVNDCVECIGESAADQAVDLSFGAMASSEVGTGSHVNDCQIAIGKMTSQLLHATSDVEQVCRRLERRSKRHGRSDNNACVRKRSRVVSKMHEKSSSSICAACGGSDQQCGGGDDLTP